MKPERISYMQAGFNTLRSRKRALEAAVLIGASTLSLAGCRLSQEFNRIYTPHTTAASFTCPPHTKYLVYSKKPTVVQEGFDADKVVVGAECQELDGSTVPAAISKYEDPQAPLNVTYQYRAGTYSRAVITNDGKVAELIITEVEPGHPINIQEQINASQVPVQLIA
jgi:hypothetical protein